MTVQKLYAAIISILYIEFSLELHKNELLVNVLRKIL